MSERRLEEVQRIFGEVLGVAPEHRAAALARCCGGDAELRAEVESLLRSDALASEFLERTVAQEVAERPERRGVRLGPWEIDEPLGEGGMGIVYRAHRADGAYEQDVVVKLIRDSSLGGDLERRFAGERQVLASLRHANIARLLDGGVAGGSPYLVMELVEGRDILAYADAERLGVRARLELFDSVCAAVQHAHANLVVHRDLKPAHVLVGADGEPKLLDFGVATMLDDRGLRDATATIDRRLTPQFASPEQVRGEPITTATDVYALGLILYELLCGVRPYDVEGGTSDADRRVICEDLPPPPSRRIQEAPAAEAADIAARRSTTPARLRRELSGELDTIVMMALRKEPDRRYPSAEAFGGDLRRYREGLPVAARPDSWGYRASKFVSRHRAGVAAAAVVALVLVGGVLATSRQAAIAAERRATAEAALATSDTVRRFLRSILVAADPREAGQNVTMREALDQAAGRIEAELADEPAVEARVREAMGMTYRTLGAHEQADAHLTRSHELAQRVFADDPEAARIAHELAILRLDQGRFAEARGLALRALATRERGPVRDDALETRNLLSLIAMAEGNFEEALAHARLVVDGRMEALGPEDPRTLEGQNTLGEALRELGRLEEALAVLNDAYQGQVRVLGERHPDTLIGANDVGSLLSDLGRHEEALKWQTRALEGLSEQFPPGSLDVVIPRINVSLKNLELGRLERAREFAELALVHGEPSLGEGHYVVGVARLALGRVLAAQGETEAARQMLERACEVLEGALGAESRFSRTAREALEELVSEG